MILKGSFVALVTPFNKDSSVDYNCLDKLVQYHLDNDTDGIVVCGTTAETPTLDEDEYKKIIDLVVKKVNKKIPVIAGASSNDTKRAVELAKICKKLGVDGILSSSPYYNKPSQNGIIEHFKKINEINIPIIIYNVPGRTGVNILPETILELTKLENVVGLKEASGNIEQMIEIVKLCKGKISILSGDDLLIMPARSIGIDGVISVVANIVPSIMSRFYKTDINKAFEIHEYLYDLSKNMFIEGNPVTVKEAMNIMGLCSNEVRLPLVKASQKTHDILLELLERKGLV